MVSTESFGSTPEGKTKQLYYCIRKSVDFHNERTRFLRGIPVQSRVEIDF